MSSDGEEEAVVHRRSSRGTHIPTVIDSESDEDGEAPDGGGTVFGTLMSNAANFPARRKSVGSKKQKIVEEKADERTNNQESRAAAPR
jgi:hypothetical protein